mgnify:CR=1 FL=1
MTAYTPSDGGQDFVTIFKTGSVDRDDYPELAELLLAFVLCVPDHPEQSGDALRGASRVRPVRPGPSRAVG